MDVPGREAIRAAVRSLARVRALAAGSILVALALWLLASPAATHGLTFTVNSTGNSGDSNTADNVCNDGTGACTLRAAIQQANVSAGADAITFSIGSGAQAIAPATVLPTVTQPVVIDGTTQPGFA